MSPKNPSMVKLTPEVCRKYDLYERSVQTPEIHAEWFADVYRQIFGKTAKKLREDFCGTFQFACDWVKRGPGFEAVAVDLDPEPLAYGKQKHYSKLTSDQKKRLSVIQQDVLNCTKPKVDMIVACNFSFYIFKKKELLRNYLRQCRKSLNPSGMLLLEMAGGPGMIVRVKERKTVKVSASRKFVYYWDQKSFDPITHDAQYAIHFKLGNGELLKDAFTYDWRLWTIPEVRDMLAEAGYSRSIVYWETEHKGKGTGEYSQSEKGDNAFSWIAYVIGIR